MGNSLFTFKVTAPDFRPRGIGQSERAVGEANRSKPWAWFHGTGNGECILSLDWLRYILLEFLGPIGPTRSDCLIGDKYGQR